MWRAVLATATARLTTRKGRSRELELERELAAVRAESAARIADLEAKLVAALQEIVELKARLAETSANSHRPPSSDPPWKKPPKKPRERSGRKRGAQLGHVGAARELVPPEQADLVVPLRPKTCRGCGESLPQREVPGGTLLRRHQVTEAPPAKAVTTEFQAWSTPCKCGETTCAEIPVWTLSSTPGCASRKRRSRGGNT